MGEILVNFQMPEELHKELKLLAIREGKTLKQILNEQAVDYIKIHKEGNPQHLITTWTKNMDIIGFPAIGVPIEKKRQWVKKQLTHDKKMAQEFYTHVCEWAGIIKEMKV